MGSLAGETLTAALLNAQVRDNWNAAFPVGSLHFRMQAATTVETTVDGFGLEANGVAVSRTTYSSLQSKLSGLSYPFGTGDGSTTMNLPDLRSRALMMAGGTGAHSDVNGLGDNDARSLASRTPRQATHTHSVSGTTGSESSHTHGAGSYAVSISAGTHAGANAGAVEPGSYSVSGTSGSGSSHSHSAGSLAAAAGGSDDGAYLVAGVWIVKY